MKMKILLFTLLSLIAVSCSTEPVAEAPIPITEDLDPVELDDPYGNLEDTLPAIDTIPEVKPPPPPSPPAPIDPPWPDPMPDPDPEPVPWPDPQPTPPPFPEPPPIEQPVVMQEIIDFPDVEAVYPGGQEALKKFVKDNMVYPEIDKEMGIQGKVYVSFVVERDGSTTNVKVMRGVSKTIDREAKRIVRMFPKWTPAEANGRTVRCAARVPITFKFDD